MADYTTNGTEANKTFTVDNFGSNGGIREKHPVRLTCFKDDHFKSKEARYKVKMLFWSCFIGKTKLVHYYIE